MVAEKRETKYRVDPETGKKVRVKDDGTDWAAPVRKPENVFVRWATGMLTNFYHIPEDQIAVRNSPLAKKKTIYVMINGVETPIRTEDDLHRAVEALVEARRNGNR